MATKGDIVERALDSLGVGGNYESEMIVRGVNSLDEMMLSWEQDGIVLGYAHTEETANPNDESFIPDYAKQASILNLATLLGDSLRLPVSQTMMSRAANAYKNLIPIVPPEVARNPYMPLGAGNQAYCGNMYPAYQSQGEDQILTDSGSPLLVDE